MAKKRSFQDLEIGEWAQSTHLITEQNVSDFAKVSGDYNPIHLDEKYAKDSKFGRKVAHGAMGGSYISALLGNELPGHGSISLELGLRFRHPIYIGDTAICRVEVIAKMERIKMVTLAVSCSVGDKQCTVGTAKVIVPSRNDMA